MSIAPVEQSRAEEDPYHLYEFEAFDRPRLLLHDFECAREHFFPLRLVCCIATPAPKESLVLAWAGRDAGGSESHAARRVSISEPILCLLLSAEL